MIRAEGYLTSRVGGVHFHLKSSEKPTVFLEMTVYNNTRNGQRKHFARQQSAILLIAFFTENCYCRSIRTPRRQNRRRILTMEVFLKTNRVFGDAL